MQHTDSGFITVLHVDQPGFEIHQDGGWLPVEPRAGYFIVNLGDSLEILTAKLPSPIKAVLHRVPELPPRPDRPDRSSFTVFLGPRYDMQLYQYTDDRRLTEYRNFRDFSVDKAAELGYEFHPRL